LESRCEPLSILDPTSSQVAGVSVARISWHGWSDCFQIQNGLIEAVVVPSIGRVMQLRLLDDPVGALWRNSALDGRRHEPPADLPLPREWRNYGGDKCWPAPQSAWPKVQGRSWPPPDAFDSQPMNAVATESSVTLTSAVDRSFGIQIARYVELDPGRPVMRIRSEFRKRTGGPVKVGVWTITQLQNPECVAILIPRESKFANGYSHLFGAQPADLRIDDGVLSLVRHPCELVKIGSDGTSLAWVGKNCVVRIDAEPGPGEYPDDGCITQVYTNPDPMNYVELETAGPLTTMNIGDRIERTAVYTASPRSTPDLHSEAIKALTL
jgi:hypothetical protein